MRSWLVVLLLVGCSPSNDTTDADAALPQGVQMNDVSIIFPLAPSGSDLSASYLSPSSSGARGVLLPEALYDAVGHISGSSGNPPPGGTGDAAYGDLYVVALRIDPCFAALAPDPHGQGCLNQLRLVVQEVRDDTGSQQVLAHDSAMHLFYALDRDELLGIVDEIVALRLASAPNGADLGPLAPHPLIVAQGLNGAMADGLRALVLRHAGASNLTRITRMSAQQAGFTWTFDGVDVTDADAPAFTSMVIPTLSGATSQQFFRGFNTTPDGSFMPATTGSDDMTALANVNTAMSLDASALAHAFDGLVRIENPTMSSPNTTDCASCHLATPSALLIALPSFQLVESANANAFVPDARFVPATAFAPTFDTTGAFNVHAFSYVGNSLAVNQRVVNETAAVVTYLNTR